MLPMQVPCQRSFNAAVSSKSQVGRLLLRFFPTIDRVKTIGTGDTQLIFSDGAIDGDLHFGQNLLITENL